MSLRLGTVLAFAGVILVDVATLIVTAATSSAQPTTIDQSGDAPARTRSLVQLTETWTTRGLN